MTVRNTSVTLICGSRKGHSVKSMEKVCICINVVLFFTILGF